ncbi:hypothetical protein OF83DRAFT_1179702 [Amylostereum chailletii]|nr:hypothetical protein OF83DRAFT_1179702 [Amylostereum chailletii]
MARTDSPYEVTPYRPFTRGEEDLVPLWLTEYPSGRSLHKQDDNCRVQTDSTIRTEIELMRAHEASSSGPPGDSASVPEGQYEEQFPIQNALAPPPM